MNWDRFFSQTSRALAAKVREAVALPSSEAARLPSTGLEGDTPVTVECNGNPFRVGRNRARLCIK